MSRSAERPGPGETQAPGELIVQSGPLTGVRLPLPLAPASVIIGREKDCDLVVDPVQDRGVGRRHVQLEVAVDGIWLQDLRSRNGTYLRGQRITDPIRLEDGDQFQLGKTGTVIELRLEAQTAPAATLVVLTGTAARSSRTFPVPQSPILPPDSPLKNPVTPSSREFLQPPRRLSQPPVSPSPPTPDKISAPATAGSMGPKPRRSPSPVTRRDTARAGPSPLLNPHRPRWSLPWKVFGLLVLLFLLCLVALAVLISLEPDP